MAYPTLANIKARLGITDSAQDDFLTSALSAARGAVESYCGYRWEYPDEETRRFEIYDTVRATAVFDISDPGLLSLTSVRAWLRWEDPMAIVSKDILLRRSYPRGTGPYQRLVLRGAYDFAEVTGVFGQGLTAPDEVAECVMLLALNVYAQGSGLGFASVEVDHTLFEHDLIGFLLRGHRRFR